MYISAQPAREESDGVSPAPRVPRDTKDDYTPEMAAKRRTFLQQQTGASLDHVGPLARSARDLALGHGTAGHALDRVDHFAHRAAGAGAQSR